jgi:ABC-type dipeptide/oligopeptide/nickel transport system permease component
MACATRSIPALSCSGEAVIAVIVPRIAQMLFVMFGISVVVFLIFFVTPGADPSARIAGRNASPETLRRSEKTSASIGRCRFSTGS